ncbi:PAS domain-containing protein [Kiloniella antarctica]|uniref:PAS domain-containing protein n=1 Tax=Kiloniella antarctica TaxID=1550907 RepID=A0ABW5BHI3_9PROT
MSEAVIREKSEPLLLNQPLQGFLTYWEGKCQGEKLPHKDTMDPVELRGLLNFIILFEVIEGGKDFKVRICGNELREVVSAPLQGELWSKLERDEVVVTASTTLKQAVDNKEPVYEIEGSMASIGRPHVCFQSIVVPLASDGEVVDFLMGAYAYR